MPCHGMTGYAAGGGSNWKPTAWTGCNHPRRRQWSTCGNGCWGGGSWCEWSVSTCYSKRGKLQARLLGRHEDHSNRPDIHHHAVQKKKSQTSSMTPATIKDLPLG